MSEFTDSDLLLYTGINVGFAVIGLLFYIVRLTGPVKSLRSSMYLVSIFSLLGCSVFVHLESNCTNNNCRINCLIGEFVSTQFGFSYFVILILNIYEILDRNWIYIICSFPLPSILALDLWHVVAFLEVKGTNTGVNLSLLTFFSTIFISLADFAINITCYWKFKKYKEVTGLKDLLNQFLSGILFSILIDVIMIAISHSLNYDVPTMVQFTVISAFLNLNIEYFLMYQCRFAILGQIQSYNS